MIFAVAFVISSGASITYNISDGMCTKGHIYNLNINSVCLTKLIESINDETITITLSHGDLQPGNVWVDKDGKIFIIDWESWNQRSIWYDKAVMFGNIRSKGLSEYIKSNDINTQTAIVCLEDIIFRLTELYNLPLDYGEKDFNIYIKSLDF